MNPYSNKPQPDLKPVAPAMDHPVPPNFGEVVVLRHPEVSSESDNDGEI